MNRSQTAGLIAFAMAAVMMFVACGERLALDEYSGECGRLSVREIEANPYGSSRQSIEDLYTGITSLKPPSELQAVHNAWVHAYDVVLKSVRAFIADFQEKFAEKSDDPIHIDLDPYTADFGEAEARFSREFAQIPYDVERVLARDGCYVRIVARGLHFPDVDFQSLERP